MDNASNCDAMATQLSLVVPSFKGANSRVRCMNHIINLTAKAFISLYFLKVKRKKVVKVLDTTSKRKKQNTAGTGENIQRVLATGEDQTPEDENHRLAIELQTEEEKEGEVESPQLVHDELVVSTVVQKAKQWASENRIQYANKDLKEALGIFPKVCGFEIRTSILTHSPYMN